MGAMHYENFLWQYLTRLPQVWIRESAMAVALLCPKMQDPKNETKQ